MKKTFYKRIIPTALMLCMILPCLLMGYKQVYGVTTDDLQSIQNEKDQKQKDLEATKAKLEELQQASTDTKNYINSLDSMITEVETSLYNLNLQVADLETQIAEAEVNLEAAEGQKDEQYEAMKLRIQFMYEHNDETYLSLLLTSQSMGEMLNRAEYISKISEYDRNMLMKYEETMKYIADTKTELENSYAEVVSMQESMASQKQSLAYIQETKVSELTLLSQQTSDAENLHASLEADLSVLDQTMSSVMAQIAAQEQANANSGNATIEGGNSLPTYDGGMFHWPTINTYITSDYGDTEDRGAPHKGIDIAPLSIGVSGDPIYAAYDGQVVYTFNGDSVGTDYNGGAGNWVVLYHGNGLYTRYLHNSAVLVSVGQKVSKGDTIALMGTTGNSTGVHLHFDVQSYANGYVQYLNPWSYFSN